MTYASHGDRNARAKAGAVFALLLLALMFIWLASPVAAEALDDFPLIIDNGLEDGTYKASGPGYRSTGAGINERQYPSTVVVKGDDAWLVVTSTAVGEFNGCWSSGNIATAPPDVDDAGVTAGIFAPGIADGAIEAYGVSYKTVAFVIPIDKEELEACLEDDETYQVFFALRQAVWATKGTPRSWNASKTSAFGIDSVAKIDASTDLPSGISISDLESTEETGVSTDSSPSVTISDLEYTKAAIATLPGDPFVITLDHEPLVSYVERLQGLLNDADRAALDVDTVIGSQTYGRLVESSRWRLNSFSVIDNSTALASGTYTVTLENGTLTGKATISSDMGKSTSERKRPWYLDKVVAEDGKATAFIRYGGNTRLEFLKMGDASYENLAEGSKSVFAIPIDFGVDTYFGVKTVNATSSETYAYMYHVVVTMDEASAEPDAEEPGGGDDPGGKDNPGGGDDPGGKDNPGGNDNPDGKDDPGGKDNPGGGDNPGGKDNPGGNSGSSGGESSGGAGSGGSATLTSRGVTTTFAAPALSGKNAAATTSTGASTASKTTSKTSSTSTKGKNAATASESVEEEIIGSSNLATGNDGASSEALITALVLIAAAACGAIWFVFQYRRAEQSWRRLT